MNFYSIPTFITSALIIFLGVFSLKKNERSPINRAFFSLCMFPGAWLFFGSIAYNCPTLPLANFFVRICYVGVVYISIAIFHFTVVFLDLKKLKKLILYFYLIGMFWTICLFSSNLLLNGFQKYFWGYYPQAGILHPLFIVIFIAIVIFSNILLMIAFFNGSVSGAKRIQVKYVLSAIFIFSLASFDFLPNYGVTIYPFGYIPTAIFVGIIAYGIVKYRLFDITIVITRVGLFIVTYCIVLGIPFGLATLGREWLTNIFRQEWFWLPMFSLLILATAGPFIYLYIQRKAEDRLLQEEKKVQELLTRASISMITVRDLQKLLKLIIDVVVKNLKVDNTAIYLLENDLYVLKVSEKEYKNHTRIESDDPLIQRLKELKQPIIYEEIKLLSESQQNNEENFHEIVRQMEEMQASVIIPTIVEDVLLGFIVVGERRDKGAYSADLINVLTVVGNQVALAIENAIFYEETGKNLAEKFHESRLKSLGTLGTGIAHQMHNRFNVITLGGEMLLQTIKSLNADKISTEDLRKVFSMVIKNVEKMVGSAFRGAEITDAIKNYAKKADAAPSVVLFKAVVKNSMELLYVKQSNFKFKFIEDYPQEVFLWVNFSNLQEMIFNAVDNSCDAMALKMRLCDSGDLNIKDYGPQVIIRGKIIDKNFTFEIEDNGLGFEEDRLKKGVDVPFFTTKGAGKGTGMGIHMMSHYVKQNGGDLKIESEHTKYTKIIITMPLATDEQIAAAKLKENMNKEGNNNGNSPT